MAEIKVGLARGKTSFWDPKTNTYLTLDKHFETIVFDETDELDPKTERLSRIAHALFCQYPALVLYEGQLPVETVNRWKARYNPGSAPQARDRADKTNAGVMPINAKSVDAPEELTLFSSADSLEVKQELADKVNTVEVLTKSDEVAEVVKSQAGSRAAKNK